MDLLKFWIGEFCMKSERLFVRCKVCGKQVSKTAKICPHCGEKLKNLSIIQWTGILFIIIIVLNVGDKPSESSSSEPTVKASVTTQKGTEIAIPAEQVQFINAEQVQFINVVEKYSSGFRDAKNELQQSSLRDQRRDEIEKSVRGRTASLWVGKITQLDTNTEGDAILSISISPNIEIRTFNNALSDYGSGTLISKGTDLYKRLFNLSAGQKVEFSGSFFYDEIDYIEETSLTIRGSMRSPEFLFRFESVKSLN